LRVYRLITVMPQTQRNSLYVEEAEVLSHQAHPGDQYSLRLQAPETAAHARPGSFVHLQCSPERPLRRPMSLMRVDPQAGWVDILYKVHGEGTRDLALRQPGEYLSLIGPIGRPFKLSAYRPRPLLLGGGVGIPPMLYLAEHMRACGEAVQPLVIMGSEVPFPFTPIPSRILLPSIPEGVIAAMPLLEDWGIASRLTSLHGYAGCFEGYVTDLARCWLDSLGTGGQAEVEIFSCGPTPMLQAVQQLAAGYGLPCQLSLEEYMACAVGGCAGCVVKINTGSGTAMKRVCVDGPVFAADTIVF